MSLLKRVAQEIAEKHQQSVGMESEGKQWGTAEDFHRNLKEDLGQTEVGGNTPFGKIFGDIFSGLNLSDNGEDEIEYSFFVKLNPEQIKAVMEKFHDCDNYAFIEVKIPCANKERKVRARQYYNDGRVTRCELTTKVHIGEKKKREYNSEISNENFISMAWGSTSITSRVRIKIPLLNRDGKKIPRRGTGFLCWELDLYFSPSVEGFHPWAKVELEVTNAALEDDDVVSKIPFEYDELLYSDTQDPAQRKLIQSLYEVHYNMIAHDMSFLDGKA